jgi:Predicted membrane protein (DUF2306)
MMTSSEAAAVTASPTDPKRTPGGGPVRIARLALATVVWISAILFAAYILARYVGAIGDGGLDAWNRDLPLLYEQGKTAATAGMGVHFIAGAILLLLGPLQFVRAIREHAPAVHRWIGRIYASAALLAGLGGLTFIALKGTVGGTPMNIGFALYGALMVLAAIMTPYYAWQGQFVKHRAWAIRLFALAIGSWLFRIDYGFWLPLTGRLGHATSFDGPFDIVMAYFFYIPNLIVAEIIIRAPVYRMQRAGRTITAAGLVVATGIVLLATYYFTRLHWGPDILDRLHSLTS